jgi:hypothetical protein
MSPQEPNTELLHNNIKNVNFLLDRLQGKLLAIEYGDHTEGLAANMAYHKDEIYSAQKVSSSDNVVVTRTFVHTYL